LANNFSQAPAERHKTDVAPDGACICGVIKLQRYCAYGAGTGKTVAGIRERINSPAGGLPDVVAWNDDHPSHSAMFVECKGLKEDFKEAQEDWLWAALCEGIKVSQFAVSVRAF
jgi:hypothetical protein